jgi:hypothetical protein
VFRLPETYATGCYPTYCAASNACVDLTSDGKNCGACGHDCLGGTCSGGQCQPVMIAQYIGSSEIIYVGAQTVYVTTDSGYVGRANKDGSDLKPPARPGFTSSAFGGTTLAEDGDRVFLVRTGDSPIRVSYCLATNCDSTLVAVGGDYSQYFAVNQADHKIFWVDYSPSRVVSTSTVGSMSAVDVPGGALESGSSGSRLFYAQGGIYFSDATGVSRIPAAGGSIKGISGADAPLTILGTNNTSLFVYDGTTIGAVSLPNGDGGTPKSLVTTTLSVGVDGHFAADDAVIYWASNGAANTCQIANCSGTQKALPKRDIDSIRDVGIDSTAVYWLADSLTVDTKDLCTVWKLAR